MNSTLIKKAAAIFDLEIEDVKDYLEMDFEKEPTFEELLDHMEYQITVCQADDPRAAFLANY